MYKFLHVWFIAFPSTIRIFLNNKSLRFQLPDVSGVGPFYQCADITFKPYSFDSFVYQMSAC